MSDTEERIPWYEMPSQLRALPFGERRAALVAYEEKHGDYIWEDHFPQ